MDNVRRYKEDKRDVLNRKRDSKRNDLNRKELRKLARANKY